jgi:hypothetical protein
VAPDEECQRQSQELEDTSMLIKRTRQLGFPLPDSARRVSGKERVVGTEMRNGRHVHKVEKTQTPYFGVNNDFSQESHITRDPPLS